MWSKREMWTVHPGDAAEGREIVPIAVPVRGAMVAGIAEEDSIRRNEILESYCGQDGALHAWALLVKYRMRW